MKIDRQQLNTNVQKELAQAVPIIAHGTGFTQGEIVETALAVLFGVKDKLILARKEKIMEAFQEAEITLPFEPPLTPVQLTMPLTELAA